MPTLAAWGAVVPVKSINVGLASAFCFAVIENPNLTITLRLDINEEWDNAS